MVGDWVDRDMVCKNGMQTAFAHCMTFGNQNVVADFVLNDIAGALGIITKQNPNLIFALFQLLTLSSPPSFLLFHGYSSHLCLRSPRSEASNKARGEHHRDELCPVCEG